MFVFGSRTLLITTHVVDCWMYNMFLCCFLSLEQVDGSYLLDGQAIQPKEFKRMSGYVMQVCVTVHITVHVTVHTSDR